jgi:hypothetical protein
MITENVSPRKIQGVVKAGFDRMKVYRRARAMFVKAYIGQYYRKQFGYTGEQPINLLYSAIRSIVPAIVSKNPRNEVTTENLQFKKYAEMQSMALDKISQRINLKELLRAWVVSAMFSMGIMKTGISANGNCILIDNQLIDQGDIYAALVDLDRFVMDPLCNKITESSFLGDSTSVPRRFFLDNDMYDSDLAMKLPSATMASADGERSTEQMSQIAAGAFEMKDLEDMVNVVELWVPGAEALITIPDPREIVFDKYLGITDYYGPSTGPYRFLSFTPPVEGNPMPVAPVSLYYDLHIASNRMFTKILDQAEDQRDLLLYRPSHADVAQDILDADNGAAVATDDPKAAQVVSFGGQNRGNEAMLSQLQIWFNYMSGNPDQIAGVSSAAETATQANILQSNAMISIEDARDILYDGTAAISHDMAWYMHHDPMIEEVLARRKPGMEVEQLVLTPEEKRGDIEDYIYKIKAKSMTRMDPSVRSKRMMEFLTNAVPALANTGMMMMQLGVPFNIQHALTMAAEELEIGDMMVELFHDPQFQEKLAMYIQFHAGKSGGAGNGSTGSTQKAGPQAGIMQNGGFPMQRNIASPGQEANQFAQGGAGQEGQGVY